MLLLRLLLPPLLHFDRLASFGALQLQKFTCEKLYFSAANKKATKCRIKFLTLKRGTDEHNKKKKKKKES